MFRGAIFDLDGVIVDTTKYLSQTGRDELLPGVLELLAALRQKGVKIGLSSASKNTSLILCRLQIADCFDTVVDGTMVTKTKPDPEVFLASSKKLGLPAWDCVAFEGSEAGIQAAKSAGMYTVGVGNPAVKKDAELFLAGLDQGIPDSLFADRLWCISEERFNPTNNRHFEGVFTTGSGYMSVRGSLEEGLSDDPQDEEYLRMPANVTLEKPRPMKSKWGTYIPGIVGPHPILNHEMINLPWFGEFVIYFNGKKVDMEKSLISDYFRYLNMYDATLNRSFRWMPANGVELEIEFNRFISLNTPNLAVQRIRVRSQKGRGRLRVESGIDARVRTNGYNHFSEVTSGISKNGFIYTLITSNGNNIIAQFSTLKCSDERYQFRVIQAKNHIYYLSEENFEEGQTIEFFKITVVTTDRDCFSGETAQRAKEILQGANQCSYQQLYQVHAAAWRVKWDFCDIVINGDESAQIAIRFSIYHLIRSNSANDPKVSICAKGHAGEAYFGRYFWDTDIFVLPFFIYTNIEAAKNLILFRYHTLEGAKQNARVYGYKGARYAWESSIQGLEESACWQYADHEIHITADVIYGLWHYYSQTADWEFMRSYGLEMLVETSRYWVERVDRRSNGSGYDLLGVMGPDEYLPFTRNNAYTNMMVKFSLEKTISMLELFNCKDHSGYQEFTSRLGLKTEEIQQFREVRDQLPVPVRPEKDLVLQSEDFEGYADLDLPKLWKDQSIPFGHFISQEKNYRSKVLKQADVLMLMFLLPDRFTRTQIQKAYDYYEPLTTHDSSLSPSVHTIIAAWLGKMDDSEKYFKKAIQIDLDVSKKGCEEGIHIANAGGIWQAVVHGVAGIKNALQSDSLLLQPRLPKGWKLLSFKILWKSEPVQVEIRQDEILLTNLGKKTVRVNIENEIIDLAPQKAKHIELLTLVS